MNFFNIRKAFAAKRQKGWPKLYWSIDLHNTILIGHTKEKVFCPNAFRVLTWISDRRDMAWILSTASNSDEILDTLWWLGQHSVAPDFVNQNPDCSSKGTCDFSHKFYCDILLDDRAGFECDKDWFNVEKELKAIREWHDPTIEDENLKPPKVPIIDFFKIFFAPRPLSYPIIPQ